MAVKWVLLTLFLVSMPKSVLSKLRESMIIMVGAGQRDCYYFSSVSVGDWINIDYQVTSAGGVTGNFDLEVELIDPKGNSLFLWDEGDFGETENKASVEGDYQICLDNSESSVSSKSVFLRVSVTDPNDGYYDWDLLHDEGLRASKDNFDQTLEGFDPKITFPIFRDRMLAMHKSLSESGRIQSMMDASYAQDLQMAMANCEKVVFWSLIHLFLVLVVGCLQVSLLKSLFQDKKLVHRLIKTKVAESMLNTDNTADIEIH